MIEENSFKANHTTFRHVRGPMTGYLDIMHHKILTHCSFENAAQKPILLENFAKKC
jgi:hypothetical protein